MHIEINYINIYTHTYIYVYIMITQLDLQLKHIISIIFNIIFLE